MAFAVLRSSLEPGSWLLLSNEPSSSGSSRCTGYRAKPFYCRYMPLNFGSVHCCCCCCYVSVGDIVNIHKKKNKAPLENKFLYESFDKFVQPRNILSRGYWPNFPNLGAESLENSIACLRWMIPELVRIFNWYYCISVISNEFLIISFSYGATMLKAFNLFWFARSFYVLHLVWETWKKIFQFSLCR